MKLDDATILRTWHLGVPPEQPPPLPSPKPGDELPLPIPTFPPDGPELIPGGPPGHEPEGPPEFPEAPSRLTHLSRKSEIDKGAASQQASPAGIIISGRSLRFLFRPPRRPSRPSAPPALISSEVSKTWHGF
jgi:hypothetical protein